MAQVLPSFSGEILPGHPSIEEGELLSSWVTRLAQANRTKVTLFAGRVLGEEGLWDHDIDRSASPALVETLARKTGCPREEVKSATLRGAYEGSLYAGHSPKGHTRWVMPRGLHYGRRKRHTLLYCPLCLREGATPYFRKKWRLALSCVCTQHEVRLLDRCPDCGGTVEPHRCNYDTEHYTSASMKPLTYCSKCKGDLRSARAVPVARNLLLHFQKRLFGAVARGFERVPGYGRVRSHLWLDGLYQLLKIIGFTKRGRRLRAKLEKETGTGEEAPEGATPPEKLNAGTKIERLSLPWRRHALYLLGWMLSDWPGRFIRVAHEGSLTRSVAFQDMTGPNEGPYWYKNFCKRHLETPPYSPSETEIFEAQDYLKRRGKPHGPKVTSRRLGMSGTRRVRRILEENGRW